MDFEADYERAEDEPNMREREGKKRGDLGRREDSRMEEAPTFILKDFLF